MTYRLYQPNDFAALYAVEELCFTPPFRFGRILMRQLIENSHSATWVAEEDSRLIGFSIVEWSTKPAGRSAYVQTIEVHPSWRGRSIGAELLRRVEDSARAAGANTISLHVDVENTAAIRLYESHGYERQRREENYYPRQRAAFVYQNRFS